MIRECNACKSSFEIYEDDLEFLAKISPTFNGVRCDIPPPTLCPHCRQQRRLAQRNERTLYPGVCSKSGKKIISMYHPKEPFPVYERGVWWSDVWDAKEYGQSFDFKKPFFQQFAELMQRVPRQALIATKTCENCHYNNLLTDCKDCYMCFSTNWSRDCYHTYQTWNCTDCVDSSYIWKCELLYECLDCTNCYRSFFLEQCTSVSESYFSFDCISCSDCFGCVGLRNQKYHYFNQPLSKEEYEKRIQKHFPLTTQQILHCTQELSKLRQETPRLNFRQLNSEDCIGDYLQNSKNCFHCFDIIAGKNFRYCHDSGKGVDFMDTTMSDTDCELLYETQSADTLYNVAFSNVMWDGGQFCYYCDTCFVVKNCFGCIGLRQAEYCILNKQYSKDEYEALVPKIIDHMTAYQEWGEFFPMSLSPFYYNDTVAQLFDPLNDATEAAARGARWHDDLPTQDVDPNLSFVTSNQISNDISQVPASLIGKPIQCSADGKLFKVVAPEFEFYKKLGIPFPSECPNCRHAKRLMRRNPRKFFKRSCTSCNSSMMSTLSPDHASAVVCEECFSSVHG